MLIYIYRYTVESDIKRMITMPFVAILAAGADPYWKTISLICLLISLHSLMKIFLGSEGPTFAIQQEIFGKKCFLYILYILFSISPLFLATLAAFQPSATPAMLVSCY